MNEDFLDFLSALIESGARFLVVGAHALAVHGVPRATGDLDIWIEPEPKNIKRVWRGLETFGAPTDALEISPEDLLTPYAWHKIGEDRVRGTFSHLLGGISLTPYSYTSVRMA